MKKTLIILILTLGALWLLVLPVAVGSYVRQWVPSWLEESGLEAQARFSSGWFASALSLEEVADLELTARHFPPLGLDWISIDGQLNSSVSPSAFQLSGQVGLSGASQFELTGESLALSEPIQIDADTSRLTLEQRLSEPSALTLRLDELSLVDELGNDLNAATTLLDLGWSAIDEDQLAITLGLVVEGPEILSLALSAQPVQREALADLIDGLQQLSQASPRSAARQFALLTIAGAWQQLSQNGLRLELETLSIGEGNQFQGDWLAEDGQPVLSGSGSIASLKSGLLPLVGLGARLAPEQAEQIIDAWLEQLALRGWLDREGERFDFRYDGSAPPS